MGQLALPTAWSQVNVGISQDVFRAMNMLPNTDDIIMEEVTEKESGDRAPKHQVHMSDHNHQRSILDQSNS